jgi:caa(3)-type oxidase subunit IV
MSDLAPSHALPTTPASPADVHHVEHSDHLRHVRLEQKRFLAVYAVLIVGTVLTVAMYYVHFDKTWQTVAVALSIATVKGAFVAAVFMHLWHGERDVYRILIYTGVVVAALFGLSIFSIFSVPGWVIS